MCVCIVHVCDAMQCASQNRMQKSEHERSAVSQSGSSNQRKRVCVRVYESKEERCKQNRKCFHYAENLVICRLLALNACCFGYWLFSFAIKTSKTTHFYSVYLASANMSSFSFRHSCCVEKCFPHSGKNTKRKRNNRILHDFECDLQQEIKN